MIATIHLDSEQLSQFSLLLDARARLAAQVEPRAAAQASIAYHDISSDFLESLIPQVVAALAAMHHKASTFTSWEVRAVEEALAHEEQESLLGGGDFEIGAWNG